MRSPGLGFLQIKKAAKAVNLFEKEDLLSRGDMFKPCLLDLHWWNHLAHWCGGDREPALISLELVITLASQLRRHRRFAIAVKVGTSLKPHFACLSTHQSFATYHRNRVVSNSNNLSPEHPLVAPQRYGSLRGLERAWVLGFSG
jgi:hypothetical protein